jgi:hypothetical protein
LINGIQVGSDTDFRHSVMVPNRVGFTRQVRSERFRVGKGWCGKREIGLTSRRSLIEGWITKTHIHTGRFWTIHPIFRPREPLQLSTSPTSQYKSIDEPLGSLINYGLKAITTADQLQKLRPFAPRVVSCFRKKMGWFGYKEQMERITIPIDKIWV